MGNAGFTYDGGLTPSQINLMIQVAYNLSTSADVVNSAHLSSMAFGLAGFGAALQYGGALSQMESDLRSATDAANGMASLLGSTDAMYNAAEDTNLRGLLGQADVVLDDDPHGNNTLTDLEFSGPDPLPTSWPDIGRFYYTNPDRPPDNFDPMVETNWGTAFDDLFRPLGAAVLVGGDALGLCVLSEAAKTSQAAASLLKIGGRVSTMATVAAGLYATLVVPSDQDLDNAIDCWGNVADRLALDFGGNVDAVRAALQVAWSGQAHDAADRKIRDFMTVGAELHEEAVRIRTGLFHVIDNLSTAHKAILDTCIGVVGSLIALAVVAPFWPPAKAILEFVGTYLTSVVIAGIGLVAALLEAFTLWLSAKGDFSAPTPPEGVPTIGGALKDLKQA